MMTAGLGGDPQAAYFLGMKFSDLAERRIRKAEAEGQLSDLRGQGKPLKPAGHGDFAAEAGFRIMAEAGALPREIELKKALKSAAGRLQNRTDPDARREAMAEFARIERELSIQIEARRKYYSTS